MKLLIYALVGMIAITLWLLSIAEAEWSQKEVSLWVFQLSRYYSPTNDQTELLAYETSLKDSVAMNCWWEVENCRNTTNGYELQPEDAGNIYSCPKEIPFDTKIKLVFPWGTVYWICKDRGGAIKNKRLDSRCGYWNIWIRNIKGNKWCVTGKAKIYKLQW